MKETDYLIVTIRRHNAFNTNGVINGVINDLTDRQTQIITFIKKNLAITNKLLAEQTGITKTSLDRDLSILKQKNIIKRIGSNKSGYWDVDGT